MQESNTIIVTGSNGQLGSELKELASLYPQYLFVFLGREDVSINDQNALDKVFSSHKPYALINCAAYTAVDKAEEEIDKAFDINGTAVGTLAQLSRQHGTKFIHISTDYVFDGNARSPLKEEDAVSPVNKYGESKLKGEELALLNNPDSIIIRTSWVYSFYGKNFVKTMIRLMKEKESINVVRDQLGLPTYAADLAAAIMHIIQSGQLNRWFPGIYHYSNDGMISWYDFAEKIRSLIHSFCKVNPIPTEQFPTPAKRPHYSVMDKTKIQKTFNLPIIPWEESLKRCIEKLEPGFGGI